MDSKEIARFPISGNREVRLSEVRRNSKVYVDIRIYFSEIEFQDVDGLKAFATDPQSNGVWHPTKKGVQVEKPVFKTFAEQHLIPYLGLELK